MSLIVQKYGGTSVGSIERIQHVCSKVMQAKNNGHDVVVVLSAMNGETDRLIQLAKNICDEPSGREYDAMVSTGEQVTTALLSMALTHQGISACSHNGRQAGIVTNNSHKRARILDINPIRLQRDLDAGKVPIVAGFQGINEDDDVTTLGRGGSDTTAVALAAALKADECQIFTDVDGVYTTDPRVVPEARRLSRITFEEMLELASLGAKVLQIRAVEFAGKYNVPLRVLSSFVEGTGTLITYEDIKMEQAIVSGIAFDRNQAKITLLGAPDRPGIARFILQAISDADIEIDMIVQNVPAADNTIDFSFTVKRDDYKQTAKLIQDVADQLAARGVLVNDRIAKLSLVGVGMKSHAGVATTMFQVLGEEGINIHLISTSEIKISVVIEEKYLELGTRALHTAFKLDKAPEEE